MEKVWADKFSFVGGVVVDRDMAFLTLADDAAARGKIPFSMFLAWKDGVWLDAGNQDWLCAGVTFVDEAVTQLLAIGEFGDVFQRGGGRQTNSHVATRGRGPKERGPLRGVHRIGDQVYVVGMDRQAYVLDHGKWSSIEQGFPSTEGKDDVVGFEAVDGFDRKEIYAVGWEGEIWQWDGKRWYGRDSPTNHILTDVCCAGNGQVYAAGQLGTLLQGRSDQWQILRGPDEDIWSLAWYRDRLYISTYENLYELQKNQIVPVKFGKDVPETFYKLSAADGVLWSIGAKDVMSFDGKKWQRIE